jgi:hypothetical protein
MNSPSEIGNRILASANARRDVQNESGRDINVYVMVRPLSANVLASKEVGSGKMGKLGSRSCSIRFLVDCEISPFSTFLPIINLRAGAASTRKKFNAGIPIHRDAKRNSICFEGISC